MCLKNYHQWSHSFCCKSRSCRTIRVVWWPPLCRTRQIPCIYCDTDGPSECTSEQRSDLRKKKHWHVATKKHLLNNIEINVTNYQKKACCLSNCLLIFGLLKAKFLKFIWIIKPHIAIVKHVTKFDPRWEVAEGIFVWIIPVGTKVLESLMAEGLQHVQSGCTSWDSPVHLCNLTIHFQAVLGFGPINWLQWKLSATESNHTTQIIKDFINLIKYYKI